MSSTRRMAICHSPRMKTAVRAPQREKLFYVRKDLQTKRSEYSKDLFVRPHSGRTYEGLFMGPKILRAIASSRKRGVLRLCGMRPPVPSGRRWECLSACLDINITSSTPTDSVERHCPHTSTLELSGILAPSAGTLCSEGLPFWG
jgi:hypothetical protein